MIFRNHCPDVTVPETALTPFVLQRAGQLGGKAALIDGLSGRAISYSQLAQRVRHTAKSLTQRGYRKGEVFTIHSPNLPEYAVAFHAIATIGGVVTMADPLCAAGELERRLNDAGAKCLITTSRSLDKALAAAERSSVREVFTFDHSDGALPFAELFECVMGPSEAPTNALIDPRKDPVALLYPGDGAWPPEGVARTHYDFVAGLCRFDADLEVDEGDVIAGAIPLFQTWGMFTLLAHALRHGATVVTLPRFDPERFLRTVEFHRVTRACLTPPLAMELARHPTVDRFDLSSLKLITTGDAWDGETAIVCKRRLGCVVRPDVWTLEEDRLSAT